MTSLQQHRFAGPAARPVSPAPTSKCCWQFVWKLTTASKAEQHGLEKTEPRPPGYLAMFFIPPRKGPDRPADEQEPTHDASMMHPLCGALRGARRFAAGCSQPKRRFVAKWHRTNRAWSPATRGKGRQMAGRIAPRSPPASVPLFCRCVSVCARSQQGDGRRGRGGQRQGLATSPTVHYPKRECSMHCSGLHHYRDRVGWSGV